MLLASLYSSGIFSENTVSAASLRKASGFQFNNYEDKNLFPKNQMSM